MKTPLVQIGPYNDRKHRDQVKGLWVSIFGYTEARNAPDLVIDRKLESQDGLFFVAEMGEVVVGTAMAGYDGHRGWIYLLAVHPEHRKKGIGSELLKVSQTKLVELGCVKINLQILEENKAVQHFYAANGYRVEKRISMGKDLHEEG